MFVAYAVALNGPLTFFYTVSQKKQDTKLLPITFPNVNRLTAFEILSLPDSVVNLQQIRI